MRDKVKRFLSILMTALMLVNLLPVGALAEGVMISNSVQGRWKKPSANVYVYVKVTGDTTGLTQNSSGWFTLGIASNVDRMGDPTNKPARRYSYSEVGVSYSEVLRKLNHNCNESIVIENVNWNQNAGEEAGFVIANGANGDGNDTFVGPGTKTWHLNGYVDIKNVEVNYYIHHVDGNKNDLVTPEKRKGKVGHQVGEVTSITIPGYKFTGTIEKPAKLTLNEGENDVYVYYEPDGKTVDVNYKTDGNGTLKGNASQSVGKVTGETLTAVEAKPNPGYDFVGWYKEGEPITGNSVPVLDAKTAKKNLKYTDYKYYKLYEATTFTAKFAKKTNLSYTVNYLEQGTNEILSPQKVKDGMTFGDSVTETAIDIPGYNTVEPTSQSLTVTAENDKNVITFYYTKKTDLSYTVNYYWGNGSNKELITSTTSRDEYTLGEEVLVEPIELVGYTPMPGSAESKKITIGADSTQNVVDFYYYKNVELTANSDTVTYDGNEHSVSGFTGAPDGVTFEGLTEPSASGTDVGEYPANFADDTVGKTDTSEKYKVTKAINGKLVITPQAVKVTVTGNTDTKVYTGETQSVDDFTTDAPEGVTVRLKTGKEAKAEGQNVGTYPMGLTKEDFEVESQNYAVELSVNDGWLEITPKAIKVTVTGNTDTKVYNGKPQSVVDFTTDKPEGVTVRLKSGKEAKAEGQNVGTYYMGLTEEDFEVESQNYKVELSVNDGWLEITPVTAKVTVTITEKSGTATYDGKEHIVSGYESMTADNPLYDEDSVEENPTVMWAAKGTDVGEYPVGIAAGDFKNTNANFTNVEFVVVDGALEITPAPVTLQAPIQSKTYDGTPLEATQFGHSYLEGVNFADDFASVILTGSQTLVGSSASLITGVIPNEGKKLTNYNFTFVPGTLTVTDGTGEEEKPVDPAKVITKTHIPKDTGYNLGEPVTFTISVTNIYNTPKTITLTEKANVKFSNGESVIVFKDVPAGETVTAEATYTITSEDILEGVFRNTVTATFGDDKSWEARDEVETAELDTTLNVTKTSDVPDGQKAALGQTITYTIKVQNAGNVPYTNVKVEDPLTGLTETIETLAVGETKTFTTEYVVTEADVLEGHVLNTATATGDKIKDPKSDEPKEPNGGDEVEIKTFAPITIKPKDVTATYNGAAITGKDVEITSGKLLEGHKLSAAVIGSGVNAGSYALTLDPEKITIVDANNKDVSEMYARTILPGKLIINKRSVLITSPSATKTYDGSALTRPAVTITGDGFVPGELAKAEATGSITNVGSTPNTIRYTTTGAFNAANYSIALSVGTLTVTEKPKPEPRRTFNLTINYVYQNGKRAAASYNRGGLKNGETFDITSPVIAGYTASETVVSGTIYNRDIKVTVIYTADGVNLDDYGVPLGLGNITMNVGDCFE